MIPNPLSTNQSIIGYFQKVVDGQYFFENFENSNFLLNYGWITLQGTPKITANVSVAGLFAFDCTAPGLPVIQKAITLPNLQLYAPATLPLVGPLVAGWFYDDLTTTTSEPGPFLKCDIGSGMFMQIGARNGTSTTKYSCNPTGNTTADTFAATSVTRTMGWHKFQFGISYGSTPSLGYRLEFFIDSTLVLSFYVATQPSLNNIYVQSDTIGSSASTSFGAFDDVGVYLSQWLVVGSDNADNANRLVEICDGTTLGVHASNLLNPNALFSMTTANVLPYNYFFLVSSNASNSAAASFPLAFFSDMRAINPGDVYVYNEIQFGRKVKTLDPDTPMFLGQKNNANQGSVETLIYGRKDENQFEINYLQGRNWKYDANNLFTWTGQGNPFSLLVDSLKDNVAMVLTAAANAGTNLITVFNPLAITITPTAGTPDCGPYYVLRNYAGTFKQVVTIASVIGQNITINEMIQNQMNPGDYIHSLNFYPFIEFDTLGLESLKVQNPRQPRYNWIQKFRDWLNGI